MASESLKHPPTVPRRRRGARRLIPGPGSLNISRERRIISISQTNGRAAFISHSLLPRPAYALRPVLPWFSSGEPLRRIWLGAAGAFSIPRLADPLEEYSINLR